MYKNKVPSIPMYLTRIYHSDMKFTVYGKPTGKARPRFAKGRAYTPKPTTEYESAVRQAYVSSGGINHDDSPITINITAYFRKAKTNKMSSPMLKPDSDNIAKIICDALNNVAYNDDKQIISLKVDKAWADDETEKVVVEVEEIIYS